MSSTSPRGSAKSPPTGHGAARPGSLPCEDRRRRAGRCRATRNSAPRAAPTRRATRSAGTVFAPLLQNTYGIGCARRVSVTPRSCCGVPVALAFASTDRSCAAPGRRRDSGALWSRVRRCSARWRCCKRRAPCGAANATGRGALRAVRAHPPRQPDRPGYRHGDQRHSGRIGCLQAKITTKLGHDIAWHRLELQGCRARARMAIPEGPEPSASRLEGSGSALRVNRLQRKVTIWSRWRPRQDSNLRHSV